MNPLVTAGSDAYFKADCVWTKDQFRAICDHMMNGNPPSDFLQVYQDEQGKPRFARAKAPKLKNRIDWSWGTITGSARSPVGIGFYPSNKDGMTRWGAMDFDAHDGDALRARSLAFKVFNLVRRHHQIFVALATSGSEGWHLFLFTRDFYPIRKWILLLKRVARMIGAEVKPGVCELFPTEVSNGKWPPAIRAPGTWNPKTGACGVIVSQTLTRLVGEGRKEGKSNPFLYHASNRVNEHQLHDRSTGELFRGIGDSWKDEYAIIGPCTRHNRLKDLGSSIFRQVGHAVARENASAQYREATPTPHANESEHITEFEQLWDWLRDQWVSELSETERKHFEEMKTESLKDAFRIVRNFKRFAEENGDDDFPISVEHLGHCLGMSHQGASAVRKQLAELGVIALTQPARKNIASARFRWLLDDAENPF